ncbi:hypothetical protein M422DRAFT_51565 [Sphaerobolus stellatus SS14]|uniref:Uncharacterized protein n=1 Tax=Sphaerobolus stellatus (strain SS14) TaxID=990650 RepID=A0A0C9VD17_SPHS4|nr:hypothetical protein M422DRAFT_51565 [Sphaerobolus stellatus SS14]
MADMFSIIQITISLYKCDDPQIKLNFANNITILLFHVGVFGTTVRYTWNRRLFMTTGHRGQGGEPVLITLLLQQAKSDNSSILFAWTLEIVIAQKPSISDVDFILRNTVAVIILCRFHLELNLQSHSDSSTAGSPWGTSQLGNFGSARDIEENIIEEFDDHLRDSWPKLNIQLLTQMNLGNLHGFATANTQGRKSSWPMDAMSGADGERMHSMMVDYNYLGELITRLNLEVGRFYQIGDTDLFGWEAKNMNGDGSMT